MDQAAIPLTLTIDEAGADAYRLDELTGYLMRDLQDLGVESVERTTKESPPEGAKGDPFTWGALTLAVLPDLVPKLVDFVQSWTQGGESRVVKVKTPAGLEVEFTPNKKMTTEELVSMVEKFSKLSST